MRATGGISSQRLIWLLSALLMALSCPAFADELSITPSTMVGIGTVDERLQSYNVEMVEVTGGRFWKPYGADRGGSLDLYQYRPPIDLTNTRLRKLALALGPAYIRVSGTWANATYFAASDSAPAAPPSGFNGILTQQQWRGVVDFSRDVGAQIVTSFAVSPGTRDASGVWSPDHARRWLNYTYSIGGRIAAAEFMNEPDIGVNGDTPAADGAASYARDFNIFRSFMKAEFPDILVLGPGTSSTANTASDMLMRSGPGSVDALSYHYYGALSERCRGPNTPDQATFRTPAFGNRSGPHLLPFRSRSVRARQAHLADGNGGGGVRREPMGHDLP